LSAPAGGLQRGVADHVRAAVAPAPLSGGLATPPRQIRCGRRSVPASEGSLPC
jgi:hypothetical protein